MKYKKWLDSELDILTCLYNKKLTVLEISKIMNKDCVTIKNALRYFKIYRPAKYGNLKINALSVVDLSYIAAIVDGEGSIIIGKRSTTLSSGEKNPLYHVVLKVTNTDPRLIDWLISKVGCGQKQIDKRGGNRRNSYRWHLTQTPAVDLLNKIEPYSVIKKEQIKIVNDFRSTYNQVFSKGGTPPDIVNFREQCFVELKKLHHKIFDE
jgi:hypothetical protein